MYEIYVNKEGVEVFAKKFTNVEGLDFISDSAKEVARQDIRLYGFTILTDLGQHVDPKYFRPLKNEVKVKNEKKYIITEEQLKWASNPYFSFDSETLEVWCLATEANGWGDDSEFTLEEYKEKPKRKLRMVLTTNQYNSLKQSNELSDDVVYQIVDHDKQNMSRAVKDRFTEIENKVDRLYKERAVDSVKFVAPSSGEYLFETDKCSKRVKLEKGQVYYHSFLYEVENKNK